MIPVDLIEDQIRRITDETYAQHEGWPTTFAASMLRWVGVIERATAAMLPASTARVAARVAALAVVPGPATVVLPQAWQAYVRVLATGMVGFVAVPPVKPLDLSYVSAMGMDGQSAERVAAELARLTKLWLQTGTATPTAGGPLVRWF